MPSPIPDAFGLIQIPQPHTSHQARSISLPLSPFIVYNFGCGLLVSMSSSLQNRWAECLDMKYEQEPCRVYIPRSQAYIAPAHFRQSMQSGHLSINGQKLSNRSKSLGRALTAQVHPLWLGDCVSMPPTITATSNLLGHHGMS